jgi:ribosomal protein S18 acetylase RimI-like enzyme
LEAKGLRLIVYPTADELDQVPPLLLGRYWRQTATPHEIRTSHARSNAWVGAIDHDRRLVAVARALGDAASRGSVYDVVVDEALQRVGLGRALMRLLLDHPALRACERVSLATRDRMHFYEHFGFQSSGSLGTMMVRVRQAT